MFMRRLTDRDHPREYGENRCSWPIPVCASGSSPRIRGEYSAGLVFGSWKGIIPANTGRMRCWSALTFSCRDHPREYGENILTALNSSSPFGPSPRIRGKSRRVGNLGGGFGTIPANTGKIFKVVRCAGEIPDHPREYGKI